MMSGLTTSPVHDERRAGRVPCSEYLTYRYSSSDGGKASCADVSFRGLGIRLGRYLRPGRRVVVCLDALPSVELKGRVAWCRPSDEPNLFDAGIRVFHDEPDSVAALSEMSRAHRGHAVDDVEEVTGRPPSYGDFPGDEDVLQWHAAHRAFVRCSAGAAGT